MTVLSGGCGTIGLAIAKEFISEIEKSGFKTSNTPIKVIKIEKKISYKEDSKKISIEPTKISSDIDFEIKYEN